MEAQLDFWILGLLSSEVLSILTCPTKYAPTTLKAKKNLHVGGGLSTTGGTSKPIPPCSHLAKEEHCRMTFFYFNSTIVDKVMCLVKHGPATKVKVNPEVVGIIGGLATTASSSKGSHHWSTAKAAGSTAKPAQSATKAAGSTAKAAGNTVKTAPCAVKAARSTAKAAHAPTTRKSRIRPLVPHRA
uniref:Uncharacterized protein n=1 Tax=Romanomermis culicivorax TaxID=13658 RepID=A0A915KKJ3_ROMCU